MGRFMQFRSHHKLIVSSLQITQKEHHLHLAAADGAPGFPELVQGVATKFSKIYQQPVPVMMDDNNADWDIIYPFSQVQISTLACFRILTRDSP